MKNLSISVRMKKSDGKMVLLNKYQEQSFRRFCEALEEGQEADVFYDAVSTEVTKAQLAKIYAGLKSLAIELGYSLYEIKNIIKENAGLRFRQSSGEFFTKSFKDMSSDEIYLIFQAMNEAGAVVGLSFV